VKPRPYCKNLETQNPLKGERKDGGVREAIRNAMIVLPLLLFCDGLGFSTDEQKSRG